MDASKLLRRGYGLYLNNLRQISSWSSLGEAFNKRPTNKINLSPIRRDTGLFGLDELQTFDGFYCLEERCINRTEELVTEAQDPKRQRRMVEIFDDMSDTLCKVADLTEVVRLTHPNPSFKHAAEDACIKINSIVEKLNTNRVLYSCLRNVVEKGDKFKTTEIDDHVMNLFLFDFEQSGIHLSEEQRRQVVGLNDYIVQVGQKFVNGAVSPRTIHAKDIPPDLRGILKSGSDAIEVSGMHVDAKDPNVREAIYRLYLLPDLLQEHLLDEMLAARNHLAQLCGFPTYGHRAVKASIMETPETVYQFLTVLSEHLRDKAASDFKYMDEIKRSEHPHEKSLACWDTAYYTQKVKKQWLKYDASDFAPYFPLGGCMEGFNMLMNRLFGIDLVPEELQPGESWAPDVYKLAVVDESEGLLGHIYCDFYEREGKVNQDCHYTVRAGKQLVDGYQNPIVVVALNLPIPRWSNPPLLTPHYVDTLFHELGHAMHSMLARTKYQHVAGTRCSTDFAEVPSILMEYFSSDPRVVGMFAKHFQTREPLPSEMLERLCVSKHLFTASETQLQVFYAAVDHHFHSNRPAPGQSTKILAELQEQFYGLPYVQNTAWQLKFSHLVGYGAKYYSYLISKAVASLIWQTYFQDEPLSRTQGEQYRRECLAHGGGKPARQLVTDFLRQDWDPNYLAISLINEINNKSSKIKELQNY